MTFIPVPLFQYPDAEKHLEAHHADDRPSTIIRPIFESANPIYTAKSRLTILRATNKNERAIDFVFIALKASETLPT